MRTAFLVHQSPAGPQAIPEKWLPGVPPHDQRAKRLLGARGRPGKSALEQKDFIGLTRLTVSGRGKQGGIQVGSARYDELPKIMLLLVIEDGETDRAVATIQQAAFTGNLGDGVIFVSDVEAAYTIRTAAPVL